MKIRNLLESAARAALVLSLLGTGQAALAQDPSTDDSDVGLAEIIVTARKFEERLQDAPVAVTLLTGETLEQRGIRDLKETTKLASSVKFDSDADVRAGIAIRGVGQSSDVNAAPGVGMFIDGVYQPSSAYYTVPFFDVERIEILKGPQGTLYGKNTLGGAISIISREPGDRLAMNFAVEGSSGPQVVANAAISVPIAGETFGNRTSVFYRYSEGLQNNRTTGENADARRDVAVRTRFVLSPADSSFESSLSGFYADLNSKPFAYSTTNLPMNDPIDNVTKNVNGNIESRYRSVNFSNSIDAGPVAVSALTSYDTGKVDTFADGDFTGISALVVSGKSKRKTFAQEVRFSNASGTSSDFRWLVGAYYSDDNFSSNSRTQANFPVVGLRTLQTNTNNEDGNTYAGFGQATLVMGGLEVTGGVRYDREKRHNVSSSLNGLTGRTSTFDAEVVSKAWQPKLSASYHFTPDVMAYGLVARGFRAGGFNSITTPAPFQSYQPEKTTVYEFGLKTELFDRRLRLNGSLFYTDYSNILLTDIARGTDGAQVVYSRNGGEARSYGGEIELAFRVTPDLTLSGGYSYLNFKNEVAGTTSSQVTGFAPHTGNVQLDYSRKLIDDVSIGAHVSASYIGKTPMAQQAIQRDAHTTVDASFDLNFDSVTFSVFGKNVFDERYYTSFIPAASTATRTSSLGLLNRGAEYGVRFSARF